MRLFLAIDLPDKVKEKLNNQIKFLKKEYPQFNWVSQENFHITIHFFGEINNLERIKNKIEKLIWNQFFFHLYSLNIDVFVNNKLVVYLNFRREKKIEKLAQIIKSNFDLNFVNTNKFIPHLTLARGPRSSKQQYFTLRKKLSKTKIDISFLVDKIVLFESILKEKKPIYKKIAVFYLQK